MIFRRLGDKYLLMKKIFNMSSLTLLVALALSTIAAYYSIIGLTAIFAGAVIPVIVMGSVLEVGKITTTVWLKKYWKRVGLGLKSYLVVAVITLALITSMGIFGFLSKAHMDNGVTSGDVQAKLALYDEKIKTERDNIETTRKALQQMDAQVEQLLSRGTTEQNAERAVAIRKQQSKERTSLQNDISKAQAAIAKLNEERAPIAAENRKVEAEVGPIKYIAAFIYGDDPNANVLERAVRWVIILLVAVFDPLAIALVLAANSSRLWDLEEEEEEPEPKVDIPAVIEEPKESEIDLDEVNQLLSEAAVKPEIVEPDLIIEPEPTKPAIVVPEFKPVEEVVAVTAPVVEINETEINETELHSTTAKESPMKEVSAGYVLYDDKMISKDALKEMHPELFRLKADTANTTKTNFGTQFPKFATKGDTFIRIDVTPNRVFRFDGKRWFEISKDAVDSYLQDDNYIQFLISKIDKGEYDIETLSEKEREQIESYLKSSKYERLLL